MTEEEKKKHIEELRSKLTPEERKWISDWARKQQKLLETKEGQKKWIEPIVRFAQILEQLQKNRR